ncbi:MAG: hypothetical protein PHS53_04350 [Candidatus Pacebacteria bacterium]|nr:hypothetical protein [Candidatus Paceibacterota bacterium]MDD5357350.1 hypothetical protein [Candidatus Paceibacterota bacterium]
MSTIINTPGNSSEDSGLGIILGVLIAIIVIVLFFVYGLPALRGSQTAQPSNGINVNVSLPTNAPASTGTTY